MPVIAMTREMGTLGKEVALGLADTMDMEIVHHELVERHIAERLHLGESAVHRFLEGRPSMIERWKMDRSKLSRYTAEEILELAAKGNVVIRGWGAAQLLSDVSHVICVRVCSPMANRVAEMAKRLGIADEAVVEREIVHNDNAHARAIQRQFSQDWRDPLTYDIVLNTGRMPVSACIAQLRLLIDQPAYQATAQSKAKLANKLIEARAQSALAMEVGDQAFASNLKVSARDGVVTVSGVVTGLHPHAPTLDRLRQIPGVTAVQDEIVVVRQSYGV